jgi:hypothetical protein
MELENQGIILYREVNVNQLGSRLFIHRQIKLAVKRVEFISDCISCIRLKGRWSDMIIVNLHAPSEDKDDDIKDRFYED